MKLFALEAEHDSWGKAKRTIKMTYEREFIRQKIAF